MNELGFYYKGREWQVKNYTVERIILGGNRFSQPVWKADFNGEHIEAYSLDGLKIKLENIIDEQQAGRLEERTRRGAGEIC